MKFKSDIEIQAGVNAGGSTGDSGQILSSTGTNGVAWIDQNAITSASDFVFFNVKNETGSTILKGKGVMAVGTDGNSGHILVNEMVANGTVEAKYFLGVLEEDIPNGGFARVISFGQLDQFNTSGQNGETWNDGQILWCDPANPGDFTITEPDGPNVKIAAAFIVNSSTNGKIQVRVQANEGIHDLHDTKITSQVDGDVLVWDNTTGVWFNDSTLNVDYANSRVGIGTTDPSARLHVEETTSIGPGVYPDVFKISGNSPTITIQDLSFYQFVTTNYKNSSGGTIASHVIQNNPGGSFYKTTFNLGQAEGSEYKQYQNGFDWRVNNDSKLIISNQTGYVGIGETNPGTKLDVNGVITATGGTSTQWNTAYTDRNKWDGGATGLVAATGRASLGLGTLATLNSVNAATITDNSVGSAELNVSGNGTTAQYLRSDGDGTFTWATPTNTTYGVATSTTLGLIELFSNTDQAVAANAVTATAGRTYGLQLNSANQGVINVPWTDTNTTYTAGGGLVLNTTEFSHADTSAQASVNNSSGIVIQDVTLDTYGHVTGLASVNLDGRYYTESESDTRFFNVAGDTVTGDATFNGTTFWRVSSSDAASQRADSRDDATSFSRLHWYGLSAASATSNFRHAWYDGASYINVTASTGGRIDFTGSAASMYIGSDRVFDDGYHPNADKWTTARTLTIGNTGKSVNGSANVSWTLAEIGAQPVGNYLPLSGGSSVGQAMTGTLYGPGATFYVSGNNSSNLKVGDGYFRMEIGRSSIQARVADSIAASSLSLNPNGGDVLFTGSGNVGIGTTSPATLLDVSSGNIGATAPTVRITNTLNVSDWSGVTGDLGRFEFFTDDTSGNAPYTLGYIGIKNDINAAQGTLPSGAMVFATTTYNIAGGAVERMRIDSTGNVGIGTTDPATSAKLTVIGNQTFGLPGNGSNTNGRFISIEGNADGGGEGSGRIFFTEHNSTTAAMDSYGMSIGYRGGSTSIVGASGNTWTGLSQIGNGEWGMWGHNADNDGSLIMRGDRAGTFVDFSGNNIQGITDAYIADQIIHTGDTNTYMQFHAADQWRVVTGGVERFEVNNSQAYASHSLRAPIFYDSNNTAYYLDLANTNTSAKFAGNVGIGTTSPSAKLHVQNYTTGESHQAMFKGGAVTTGDYSYISLNNGYSTEYNKEVRLAAVAESGASNTTGFAILTSPDTAGASGHERLRVTAGGNVGIGTTSPGAKLEVDGDVKISLDNQLTITRSGIGSLSSDSCIYIDNTYTGFGNPSNIDSDISSQYGSRHIVFRYNGNIVGNIVASGTSGVAYNTSASDERLKKNIEDWQENILDKFEQIEPKKFNFIAEAEGEDKTKGFIAQKMVDNFPEAYPNDYSEEKYYSFNPSGMVVYLMKAVKELVEKNKELENRIQTLENK